MIMDYGVRMKLFSSQPVVISEVERICLRMKQFSLFMLKTWLPTRQDLSNSCVAIISSCSEN